MKIINAGYEIMTPLDGAGILRLRTSTAAHPQIREVAVPLLAELKAKIPVVFGDILEEGRANETGE